MSDEFRMGLVGCGGIARAHGRAAIESRRAVRFSACCDVVREKAESWAATFGGPTVAVYDDFEEMIRREDLDAVLLATWPNQHREQIARCLDAGMRRILCEKALTLTGEEAVEVLGRIRGANALLMEGFMYRHHPAIRKLERVLSGGEVGPVDSVRACFHAFDAEEAPAEEAARDWRQRKECGGGVPYDFACYCVNACQHFAGGVPVRVTCRGNVSERYGVIHRMYGLIEYDSGRVGLIESSKKAGFSQELQITCAHAILNLPIAWTPGVERRITQRRSIGWGKLMDDVYAIEPANSHRLQLENFVDAARGLAPPVMPLLESVVNCFTVEALVRSVLEERPVEVQVPAEAAREFRETVRTPGT